MKNKKSLLILLVLAVIVLGVFTFFRSKMASDIVGSTTSPKEASDEVKTVITEDKTSPFNKPEALVQKSAQNEALEKELKEFEEEIVKANNDLPTFEDVKTLSEEEVHHTPAMVLDGGRAIGRILELAESKPAVREKSLEFLKACAENSDIIQPIRATCWKNLLDFVIKWDIFIELAEAKVPADIQALASKLP